MVDSLKVKRGAIVEIYEDPITQEKLEGKAKLLRFLHCDPHAHVDYRLEDWSVAFVDDPSGTFRRRIRVDD